MNANIWRPDSSGVLISGANIIRFQALTAIANQSIFTLTEFSYIPNNGSLLVFVNGVAQTPNVGFTETNETTFTLAEGCLGGETILAMGQIPNSPGELAVILDAIATAEAAASSAASSATAASESAIAAEGFAGSVDTSNLALKTGEISHTFLVAPATANEHAARLQQVQELFAGISVPVVSVFGRTGEIVLAQSDIETALGVTHAVKTVNSVAPDVGGNIAITIPAEFPAPTNSVKVGQFVTITSSFAGNCTLPASGNWAYFVYGVGAGVAAGGTLVGTADHTNYPVGFAWRLN